MKKRTLRRCMAEEISDDQLRQLGGAMLQTDPEGVPTYNEKGEEID